MKKYFSRSLYLATWFLLAMLLLTSSSSTVTTHQQNITPLLTQTVQKGINTQLGTPETFSITQTASWWNTTFHYRRNITLIETNGITRKNQPLTITLSFTDEHASPNSLRMLNSTGDLIPIQLWDTTYYGSGYIQSTKITFPVNISASSTATYWLYYTDQDVEAPVYSSQLVHSYSSNSLSVDNGLYTVNIGTDTYDWTIDGYDFFRNTTAAPEARLVSPETAEYVYHVGGDDIYIVSWYDNTHVQIVNATGGNVLNDTVLDSGDLFYMTASSSNYLSDDLILKIVTNNTVTFQIYDGQDDTWSYTGAYMYAWVTRYVIVTAYDQPARVQITDITDSGSSADDSAIVDLAPGETWAPSSKNPFDNDVVRIISNVTVHIVGGSIEELTSTSTWSGPESYNFEHSINQTFYRVRIGPSEDFDGFIGILSLYDSNSVNVTFTSNRSLVWSGTLALMEVKTLDVNGSTYDIKSSKPIVVVTALHQDDENPNVNSPYIIGGCEVASNDRLYYVINPVDPNLGSQSITVNFFAIEPDTFVTVEKSTGTTEYSSLTNQWDSGSTTLAAGVAAKIYSTKPLVVRVQITSTQEESVIVINRKQQPQITSITELEAGPVFAKYQIVWNNTGPGMHTTENITFFYGTPIINISRTYWWDKNIPSGAAISFEALTLRLDTLKITAIPSINYRVDKQIVDGNVNDINVMGLSTNYFLAWDSSGSFNHIGLGIIFDTLTATNDANYNFYEITGGFDLGAGLTYISLDLFGVYTLAGSSNNIELSSWLIFGKNIATSQELIDYASAVKNAVSVNIGDEEVSLRLKVHVDDLDGNSFQGANVSIYDAGDLILSELTNSTGDAFFPLIPHLGSYLLSVFYDTSYNNIRVFENKTITFVDSDIGTIKQENVIISIANLEITVYDMNGTLITSGDAKVNLLDASDNTTIIAQGYTDANGKVAFTQLPGYKAVNYTIQTIYLPAGTSYTFNHEKVILTATKSVSVYQPINTISIKVIDYDGSAVENVKVERVNLNTSDTYNLVSYTNSDGWVTFTRVKTGTLNLSISWTNAYGQQITNETTITLNNSKLTTTIVLPKTTLIVHVIDEKHDYQDVSGATVFLNYSTGESVTSSSTNDTGYAVFADIRGCVEYNLSATKNGAWNFTLLTLHRESTVQLNLSIGWADPDTTLILYNQTVINCVWDDNITLVIGFVNRTDFPNGSTIDECLTNTDVSKVAYTIYLDEVVVWQGELNYTEVPGNWTTTLDIGDLNLNASNLYLIRIAGYTAAGSGFANPSNITLTLVVSPANTSVGGIPSSITVEWSKNVTLNLWFFDEHGINITDADTYTYSVYSSSGNLINLGNGNYTLNLNSSDPNGLDLPTGNYTLYIHLMKHNYINQTISIPLNVIPKATTLSTDITSLNINWSYTFYLTVDYYSYGVTISGAIVNASWDTGTIYTTYTYESGHYKLLINTSDVNIGLHTLTIRAWLQNYTYKETSITINVTALETSLSASGTVFTVNWTETVYVEFTYIDLNHSIAISGATIYNTTWDDTITVTYNATTGRYIILINTNVEPDNYTITFTFSKQNYITQSMVLQINVLIPLKIDKNIPEFVTSAYWLDNYTLYLKIVNEYNNSLIPDATVNLTWSGVLGEVTMSYNATSGLYYYEFNTTVSNTPGTYQLIVSAYRTGATSTSSTIYLNIKELPTTISLYNPTTLRLSYGDVQNITVFWNETYHGVAVTTADLAKVDIYRGEEYITTLNLSESTPGNYSFIIDTISLGLDAGYSYTFIVTLSKNGYSTPGQIVYSVTVIITTTELIVDMPSQVYWTQLINISILFNDTLHGVQIADANVTVTIGSNTYTLEYNATTGLYSLIVNSSDFSAGTYTVKVTATKLNYADQSDALSIKINPVPTGLTVDMPSQVYWTQLINISILFNDTLHGVQIAGANVTVTIGNNTYTLEYNATTGLYSLIVNSSDFSADTYTVEVGVIKANYANQTDVLSIKINPVPTTLELLTNETAFDILVGTDNVTITVKYIDTLNNKSISGANVTITVTVVNETYTLVEISPGIYQVVIKTVNYTVSKYSLLIRAEKPNYSPAEITDKVITVNEPVIVIPGTSIAVPVSSVYNIGGGALAAVAFVGAGLYTYRIYKIPWIIRYLDKTIKLLIKGKSVDFSKFPTLEETLNEALSPYFESIGTIPKMEKE
ncbi:MAG: hypothetical protein J7L47_04525 [Candidatus Odinarchaeota archaeon]|nr:hypothetical protein [Candidatus Odinarchaeota archaeon]